MKIDKKQLYNSRAWKRLRRYLLAKHPVCVSCHRNPANEIDHIVSLEDGGDPLSEDNLQSLCKSCHSIKTAAEDNPHIGSKFVKGCDSDGNPLDPKHFWNSESKVWV